MSQVTKNYKMFKDNKFQPSNRRLITKDLKDSILRTKGNILQPILVDMNYNILDGLRRFACCKATKTPVYYVQILDDIDTKDVMISVNSTQRKWTLRDYIQCHSVDNNFYHTLNNILNDMNIPLECLISFTPLTATKIKQGVTVEVDYNDLFIKIEEFKRLKLLFKGTPTNYIHRTIKKLGVCVTKKYNAFTCVKQSSDTLRELILKAN